MHTTVVSVVSCTISRLDLAAPEPILPRNFCPPNAENSTRADRLDKRADFGRIFFPGRPFNSARNIHTKRLNL